MKRAVRYIQFMGPFFVVELKRVKSLSNKQADIPHICSDSLNMFAAVGTHVHLLQTSVLWESVVFASVAVISGYDKLIVIVQPLAW